MASLNRTAQFSFGLSGEQFIVRLDKEPKRKGGAYTLAVTVATEEYDNWGFPYASDMTLYYSKLKATTLEDAKLEARQVLLALAWDLEKKARDLTWV